MNLKIAPVVIFSYKRLDHLKKCILALQENNYANLTPLIIYSDAPKSEGDGVVDEVRSYIKDIKGFKSLKIVLREENYGLSKSIISGIDEIFLDYDSVIVLEDDIVVCKDFLEYMNYALEKFQNVSNIGSVNAYTEVPFDSPYLALGADCWGWATWKNRWEIFEKNSKVLMHKINSSPQLKRKMVRRSSGIFYNMLNEEISGNINSWAIRWYSFNFINGWYGLYPATSLVNNIGADNTATHMQITPNNSNLDNCVINLELLRVFSEISENKIIIKKISQKYLKIFLKHKFERLIKRIGI